MRIFSMVCRASVQLPHLGISQDLNNSCLFKNNQTSNGEPYYNIFWI